MWSIIFLNASWSQIMSSVNITFKVIDSLLNLKAHCIACFALVSRKAEELLCILTSTFITHRDWAQGCSQCAGIILLGLLEAQYHLFTWASTGHSDYCRVCRHVEYDVVLCRLQFDKDLNILCTLTKVNSRFPSWNSNERTALWFAQYPEAPVVRGFILK